MKRHEYWRSTYYPERYMAKLSDQALFDRLQDFISVISTLNDEGKLSPLDPAAHEDTWALCTHVLEELHLRGLEYPPDLTRLQVPKPGMGSDIAATLKLRKLTPNHAQALYRYGEARYLRPLLEKGELRLRPASSYADPSLCKARQDLELSVVAQLRKHHIGRKTPFGQISQTAFNLGASYEVQATTDFYILCFAAEPDFRLYRDFESDACIIISDRERFISQIKETTAAAFGDNFQVHAGHISYFDPLGADLESLTPIFSKHFRFAYQKEFRIAWIPKLASDDLPQSNLTIGSLRQYCEVIEVDRKLC